MSKYSEKFKNLWEAYNGFALISIILGIICFFFAWFERIIFESHIKIYILDLFYYDLRTTLFGLLYFWGIILLVFYYAGVILNNRGNYGTPMEKHSKTFFNFSVISLSTFIILFFIHGLLVQYDPVVIIFHYFYWWREFINSINIQAGFILGVIMFSFVIASYLYDKFMLQQHYKRHLPEYLPNRNVNEKMLDESSTENHLGPKFIIGKKRIIAFLLIQSLIVAGCIFLIILWFSGF
ncbi:MAG: hypothetical protein HWN65_06525 [Candidatus Helarchaeota archaeon]|nr:hypothetical protein [Candidatus Helarchaeota archaeon]